MTNNDKYNKILKAAVDTFSAKGFERTTVSDIVQAADVAKGTFYLYFQSKHSLVPAISIFLLNETLSAIKNHMNHYESMSIADIVETMIDETFQVTKTYKNVVVLCYSGLAFEHSLEKWEEVYEPYYHWFQQVLEKKCPSLVGKMDIKQASIMIINMIEHASERYHFSKDDEPYETRKQFLSQFILNAISL